MTTRREHRKGVLLMASACVCWSLAGIIVRNTEVSNSWEVVFWRSFFSFSLMAVLLVYWHKKHALSRIRETGWAGFVSGAMFAVMITFFLLAIQLTTVANTQAIMSLAPFTGALGGWMLLKEKLPPKTVVAIACACAGTLIMFADSIGTGQMLGNWLALMVPLAYGVNVTVLRKAGKSVDMMPAVLLGSLFSALVALPLAFPATVSLHDLTLLAFMGFVQLALGCILFIKAARYLSAAEIGLIGLLETILAPLWVWLGVGERPSHMALIGGVVVIGSLAANELFGLVTSNSRRNAVPALRL